VFLESRVLGPGECWFPLQSRRVVLGLATTLLLTILATGCGGSSSSQGPPPPPGQNSLGTVIAAPQVPCDSVGHAEQGVPGGTCYQVTVSCPGIANQDVAVKVNSPAGSSKGTILLTVGGGGILWYDQHFMFGTALVTKLLGADFTTVQFDYLFLPVGFPPGGTFAGWLTGPGGPRNLACRWATAAQWAHDNIRAGNTAFCATGNSAGSAVAAYAITHYGMDSVFNMLEETSGPPLSRLDHGCICNSPPVFNPCFENASGPPGAFISECYLEDGNAYIDPAYNPLGHICSSAETSHDTTNQTKFINDSILAPGAKLSYPNTDIHFVFGGQDGGSADPQAMEWVPLITAKAPVTVDCVPDAPHQIPDVEDGAQKIADDLILRCHQ
jgi:hypothetical protein